MGCLRLPSCGPAERDQLAGVQPEIYELQEGKGGWNG